MVRGVGGSEQGVQGIGPPLLGLGDNPLTFSDALVKCVAWRFHVKCCHCLHAKSSYAVIYERSTKTCSRTWLRRHWTALTLVLLSFQMYRYSVRILVPLRRRPSALPDEHGQRVTGSRSTTDFTETCYRDANPDPEEDRSRDC